MRKSGTVEKIARHKLNDEINWVCVYGVNSHNGSSWIDGGNKHEYNYVHDEEVYLFQVLNNLNLQDLDLTMVASASASQDVGMWGTV